MPQRAALANKKGHEYRSTNLKRRLRTPIGAQPRGARPRTMRSGHRVRAVRAVKVHRRFRRATGRMRDATGAMERHSARRPRVYRTAAPISSIRTTKAARRGAWISASSAPGRALRPRSAGPRRRAGLPTSGCCRYGRRRRSPSFPRRCGVSRARPSDADAESAAANRCRRSPLPARLR